MSKEEKKKELVWGWEVYGEAIKIIFGKMSRNAKVQTDRQTDRQAERSSQRLLHTNKDTQTDTGEREKKGNRKKDTEGHQGRQAPHTKCVGWRLQGAQLDPLV